MTAKVSILMALYNGAAFLPEQLDTLASQSHAEWTLTCSDDGSSDGSRNVVSAFCKSVPQEVDVIDGPKAGFARNFLSLIDMIPDDTGPVMFSDQDDIWFNDKIARAVAAVAAHPADKPVLYGSASTIWTAGTDRRKHSQHQRYAPCFANALVENFATGNTFCMNPAAALLLRDASRDIGDLFAHDWWAYALISGAGGRVIYDDEPTLLYRQHRLNQIGAGETLLKRQLRNLTVASGHYRDKVGKNLAALQSVRDRLTPANVTQLNAFAASRDAQAPWRRVHELMRSGVIRQSRRDYLGLLGAAVLGKV